MVRNVCLLDAQVGRLSRIPAHYTWQVLQSAPSVVALRQPDPSSGSLRPTFQFAADWGALGDVGHDINGSLSFEVLLLSDADLGSFHVPPPCSSIKEGSTTQRDCVSDVCTSASCYYYVTLTTPRVYTLQVHTKLFSSAGPTATLQWTYVKCSTSQYGIASGNDTLTCAPCPANADCSGNTVSSTLLVDPEYPGFVNVVQQQHITAQPGTVVCPHCVVACSARASYGFRQLSARCRVAEDGGRVGEWWQIWMVISICYANGPFLSYVRHVQAFGPARTPAICCSTPALSPLRASKAETALGLSALTAIRVCCVTSVPWATSSSTARASHVRPCFGQLGLLCLTHTRVRAATFSGPRSVVCLSRACSGGCRC